MYFGDDDAEVEDLPDPTLPCEPTAGSTCEAAYMLAEHTCARAERCNGAVSDACVGATVEQLCAVYDCRAPYANFDGLQTCIAVAEQQVCDTIGPPLYCKL